jgi:hypothetical protein
MLGNAPPEGWILHLTALDFLLATTDASGSARDGRRAALDARSLAAAGSGKPAADRAWRPRQGRSPPRSRA